MRHPKALFWPIALTLANLATATPATAQTLWQKMKENVLQQQCQQGYQQSCQALARLKAQLKQRQAPQQPGQQQQTLPAAGTQGESAPAKAATEGAGQQAAGSQSAQAWTPPTQEATPPNPAGPLDPMKLPDIQGIHLGMTVEQANQVLARLAPGNQPGWYNSPMELENTIVVGHAATARELSYDWVMEPDPWGKTSRSHMVLEATNPPDAERIWHIGLRTQFQHVNRAVLLAALRKKYGKEFAATDQGDGIAIHVITDDSRIQNLWWALDEQGRPLSPAPSMGTDGVPNECRPLPGMTTSSSYETLPGCMWVGVSVRLGAGPGQQIIDGYDLVIWDPSLKVREEKATNAWLNAQLEKARKAALQKSKEAKPTL